jgi:hypothetical protein
MVERELLVIGAAVAGAVGLLLAGSLAILADAARALAGFRA